MSASEKPTPPDFDEEFTQAVSQWREQHKIKTDDAVLLLLDLFRIHQNHWDEIHLNNTILVTAIEKLLGLN